MHRVAFTQDGTGGHTVTYGGDPVTVDTTAGASTLVEVWPGGSVVYPGAATPIAGFYVRDNGDGTYTLTDTPPVDTTAPTVPAGLTATATGETTVDLSWSASTDAVGVTGYEYRIGAGPAVDAGGGTTETVSGLTAATLYSFTVRAYDAAGNRSAWSTVATATTDATPDTTPPTVGTMAASAIGSYGFTLTVSGASDEVGGSGLHATPYAFALDGVWAGYQASPAYSPTGLDASTAYACNWRVRDAAGNVSTGTEQTVTTAAAVVLTAEFLGAATKPDNALGYVFPAMALGAEAGDRTIVVCVVGTNFTGTTSVAGVTVAGQAVTLDAARDPATTTVAIGSVALPAGTTGDVVVTLAEQGGRCGVALYRLTGAAPVAQSAAVATSKTVTVTGQPYGVTIVAGYGGSYTGWTNLTPDCAELFSDDAAVHLSSGRSTLTGSQKYTMNVLTGPAVAAVAYRP